MGQDKYKRAYKFEVEVGGLTLVECDRLTGISIERTVIEHQDAQGDGVPLIGPKKISHLELHNCNPNNQDFFDWHANEDPERKSGSILVKDQARGVIQTVTFSDMLPESIGLDDLDRKTEEKHGATYKVACIIRSIN